MAEGNYRDYLKTENVFIKKYFYVLRPLLACSWIEEKNTMAPMEFQILLDSQINDIHLKKEINRSLNRKVNGEELGFEPKIIIINNFLEEKIDYYKKLLSKFKTNKKTETEKLNIIFRNTLNEVEKSNISLNSQNF